ncbi:uncharacterized protein LOC135983493 [Chrysemys picta bellii]|uniref:uncharacterized protein LOC135983493 n=1 Tax=Chrysemys picta bellii TaxID=8478 RepID=UPI0032B30821
MAKILEKVSKAMKDRGHNRDAQKCRVKIKELRQAYRKAREANGRSGAESQTCCFYTELHAMLGGAATTTPTVCFDSFNGETRREVGSGYEEDEDEDNVDSSQQQGSGETSFPNSQDMFITLDLEPVTPELTQGMLPDPEGTQGTSAANVSPSQRLVKIRKRKRRTWDDMFTELQVSSHADRAQQNAWRQSMSDYRKAQYEREERWRAESRDEQSKWRAEDDRWHQLADKRLLDIKLICSRLLPSLPLLQDHNPQYLGVTLDRLLNYRQQLDNSKKKIKRWVNISQKRFGK